MTKMHFVSFILCLIVAALLLSFIVYLSKII